MDAWEIVGAAFAPVLLRPGFVHGAALALAPGPCLLFPSEVLILAEIYRSERGCFTTLTA